MCLFPSLKASDDNSTAYLTGLLGELHELIHVTNASNGAWRTVSTQRVTTTVIVVKTHLRLLKSFNTFLNVYYVPGPLWISWSLVIELTAQ